MQRKSLTLLEFNEVNFDLIQRYIEDGMSLLNFERLINSGVKESTSEQEYQMIEPWIQWPSVHTGLTANEHSIFRLGDIVESDVEQIFDFVHDMGMRVGCISPMNASNEHRDYAFFIPDPWTQTSSDKSWQSRAIHEAISKAVNNNSAGELNKKVLLKLAVALSVLLPVKSLLKLVRNFPELKSQGFKRAIFLDLILTEVYITLAKKHRIDFGVLFLNGLAHIQHHYFHSCPYSDSTVENPSWYVSGDPIGFALKYYDEIIGNILDLRGAETLLATGLSQIPYDNPIYYYRLKDHDNFIKSFGITYSKIHPRMTRDFLISFNNNEDRDAAKNTLEYLKLNDKRLFGQVEERDKELFVVLDYPYEITPSCGLINQHNQSIIAMLNEVNFVALKNGHHSNKGYVLASNWEHFEFDEGSHIKYLNETFLIA